MTGDPAAAQSGHLYMQTNELRNAVVHYRRSADGTIEEVDRVSTGGAGSSTSARPETRSRDGAAPPSRWRTHPKRARSTPCIRSVPTTSG